MRAWLPWSLTRVILEAFLKPGLTLDIHERPALGLHPDIVKAARTPGRWDRRGKMRGVGQISTCSGRPGGDVNKYRFLAHSMVIVATILRNKRLEKKV